MRFRALRVSRIVVIIIGNNWLFHFVEPEHWLHLLWSVSARFSCRFNVVTKQMKNMNEWEKKRKFEMKHWSQILAIICTLRLLLSLCLYGQVKKIFGGIDCSCCSFYILFLFDYYLSFASVLFSFAIQSQLNLSLYIFCFSLLVCTCSIKNRIFFFRLFHSETIYGAWHTHLIRVCCSCLWFRKIHLADSTAITHVQTLLT